MIRSVVIQNLRGIRDGRLEALGALVVLVGPNGSGKSTVLDALLIGASARPHDAAARAVQRHGVALGIGWLLWRAGQAGAGRIQIMTSAGESRTCQLKIPQEQRPRDDRTPAPAREPASCALEGVPELHLVEPTPRGSDPPLTQLYVQALQHGRRGEVVARLVAVLPGLAGLELGGAVDAPHLDLVFETHRLPAALAGDGVRRLLRLGLELAACERGVVLLEEPETQQHPGTLRESARAILAAVRRGVQVVVSTQSLELLDALLAECRDEDLDRFTLYRLVLQPGGALDATCLPGSDVALLRHALAEDLR